jgi:hypothetical protein
MNVQDVVAAARQLRASLAAAFPETKFSVRSERFAGGEAIRVEWTDGPTGQSVEQIAKPFESIDRDMYGEILGGGNRYVSCDRQISPAARAWAVEQAASLFGAEMPGVSRVLAQTAFDAQGRPQA